MSKPIHVTDATFEKEVLQAKELVLVDFWAPWCGPCHMIAPALEEIAAEFSDNLVVAKVNVDDNGQYAQEYRVQGIPTLILVKDGQEVDRIVGAVPASMIRDKVNAQLAVPA